MNTNKVGSESQDELLDPDLMIAIKEAFLNTVFQNGQHRKKISIK